MQRTVCLFVLCGVTIFLGNWQSSTIADDSSSNRPSQTTTLEPLSLLEAMMFIEQETGAMFTVATQRWLDCNDNEYEILLHKGFKESCDTCVAGTVNSGQGVLIPGDWVVNELRTCAHLTDIEDPVPCVFQSSNMEVIEYGSVSDYCDDVSDNPYRYMTW